MKHCIIGRMRNYNWIKFWVGWVNIFWAGLPNSLRGGGFVYVPKCLNHERLEILVICEYAIAAYFTYFAQIHYTPWGIRKHQVFGHNLLYLTDFERN